MSSREDVPGSHQSAATPILEAHLTPDTVADIDQPGVLAQLSLDTVDYPALAHQSVLLPWLSPVISLNTHIDKTATTQVQAGQLLEPRVCSVPG